MTIYHGWWPTEPNYCIRCGKETGSILSQLCDTCHDYDDFLREVEADMNNHLLPYFFYILGSIAFLAGSIISMLQGISK